MRGVSRTSADWINLRRFIMEEIEASRARLESNLPFENTVFERGQIAALRRLIDEVEPVVTPKTEDANYG